MRTKTLASILARAIRLSARILRAQPRAKVLRALRAHPAGLTARDIQRFAHLRRDQVAKVLEELAKEGMIEERPRKGRRGPATTVYRLQNLSQFLDEI